MRIQDFSMSLGVAEKVFMARDLWLEGLALLASDSRGVKVK